MKMVVIDSDYNFNRNDEPVIRLFGKIVGGEMEGQDAVLHAVGMEPYFFLGNTEINIFELQKMVEIIGKGYVKRCEIVKRYLPLGYQIEKSNMLRIVLFNPKVTPDVRQLLKERIPGITDTQIFEGDILFKYRFMIDYNINGMDIVEFNENKIPNYGINISNDNLYICTVTEIKVLKDEKLNIEY